MKGLWSPQRYFPVVLYVSCSAKHRARRHEKETRISVQTCKDMQTRISQGADSTTNAVGMTQHMASSEWNFNSSVSCDLRTKRSDWSTEDPSRQKKEILTVVILKVLDTTPVVVQIRTSFRPSHRHVRPTTGCVRQSEKLQLRTKA